MNRRTNRLIPTALLLVTACGVESPLEPEASLAEASLGPEAHLELALVSPIEGETVAQNDPSIGCPAHTYRGYGFRLTLEWEDAAHPSGIRLYEVWAQHEGSRYPMIDLSTETSRYSRVYCNAFVVDRNLYDWRWKVRAVAENGETGPWSEGVFAFEPCRLQDGTRCSAPAGS